MNNYTVIITGCGIKPIEHIYTYKNKPTHESLYIDNVEYKMNVGTATAYYLASKGIEVIMVSRTEETLEKIKMGFVKLGCKENLISYMPADITSDIDINNLINKLPKGKNFYWVQSIGMGGGAYKVPNDNIYLPFEEISPDLISNELNIVTATHRMMLKIIPILRNQIKNGFKAKISIITSMSGERGYHLGSTHVAAKHALVGYIKGIEKELEDEGIEIYDIRPGGIDTGMYDNEHVRKSVEEIGRRTKMWKGKNPIYENPIKVGEKVYKSLFNKKPKKIYKILAPHQS